MGKAVLISIRPEWVEKIARGEKTVEVRKTRPKLDTPFKCYIYCTQGNDARRLRGSWGKVIGEFICDRCCGVVCLGFDGVNERPQYFTRLDGWRYAPVDDLLTAAQLTREDLEAYLAGGAGYGWHISDLLIYDQPRELTEFRRSCPNDLYCEACAMYSNNNGICNNGALPLRRPPQSWCYVEAMKDV